MLRSVVRNDIFSINRKLHEMLYSYRVCVGGGGSGGVWEAKATEDLTEFSVLSNGFSSFVAFFCFFFSFFLNVFCIVNGYCCLFFFCILFCISQFSFNYSCVFSSFLFLFVWLHYFFCFAAFL